MGRKGNLNVGGNTDLRVLNHTGWCNTKGELVEIFNENGKWKRQNLNDFSITEFENRGAAEEYIRKGDFVYMGVGGEHTKHKKKGDDGFER